MSTQQEFSRKVPRYVSLDRYLVRVMSDLELVEEAIEKLKQENKRVTYVDVSRVSGVKISFIKRNYRETIEIERERYRYSKAKRLSTKVFRLVDDWVESGTFFSIASLCKVFQIDPLWFRRKYPDIHRYAVKAVEKNRENGVKNPKLVKYHQTRLDHYSVIKDKILSFLSLDSGIVFSTICRKTGYNVLHPCGKPNKTIDKALKMLEKEGKIRVERTNTYYYWKYFLIKL